MNNRDFTIAESIKQSSMIIEKINESITYAQHLYAALCYNSFQHLDLVSILQNDKEYYTRMDSEMLVSSLQHVKNVNNWRNNKSHISPMEFGELCIDEQEVYLEAMSFVDEGCITYEIANDLKSIGWIKI